MCAIHTNPDLSVQCGAGRDIGYVLLALLWVQSMNLDWLKYKRFQMIYKWVNLMKTVKNMSTFQNKCLIIKNIHDEVFFGNFFGDCDIFMITGHIYPPKLLLAYGIVTFS